MLLGLIARLLLIKVALSSKKYLGKAKSKMNQGMLLLSQMKAKSLGKATKKKQKLRMKYIQKL